MTGGNLYKFYKQNYFRNFAGCDSFAATIPIWKSIDEACEALEPTSKYISMTNQVSQLGAPANMQR